MEIVRVADVGPAERHRRVAANFARVLADVGDLEAPTPVASWRAGDVVEHLLDWFPAFLATAGVVLPAVEGSLAQRWDRRSADLQALLDDGGVAGGEVTHPKAGTHRFDAAVDLFYTSDVFMHTWDLARAAGVPDGLDPEQAERTLAGMRSLEDALRASGQYGPAQPVGEHEAPVVRLMAFVGRDPHFGT